MKRLSILLAAMLLALACEKTGENVQVDMDVRLSPIITRALSLNFRENDKIGVNISMDTDGSLYAENAQMQYNGNCFVGDLKWYKDGSATSTITAWYPYSETGFPSSFTVASDQSTGTEASDFMLAVEKGVMPSSNAVLAKFHHKFSQINVVIRADFDVQVEEILIKNVIPTAELTFAEDGSLNVSAKADAALIDIKAEEITAGKLYSVVLVPQDLSSFGLSVKIKNGATILSGISDASLKAGFAYTITANVSADQVDASISGEIAAWEDGGNLDSGNYEVPFEEHDDYFIYDGTRYNTVEIDGKRWMASPLAYLPIGQVASSDPTSGNIFYPYSPTSDGKSYTMLTDNASIKSKGYLYKIEAALGGVTLTDSNFANFEGIQGICPKGWHIPTRDEYFSLCGYSVKRPLAGETGPQTNENAYCWDSSKNCATVAKFNEAGFNYVLSGMIFNGKPNALVLSSTNCENEQWHGNSAVTYLLTSSAMYQKDNEPIYYYAVLMTTFNASNSFGKVTLSNLAHNAGAAALRCVKDATPAI